MKYDLVLSDAGDIIFDTKSRVKRAAKILTYLFEKNGFPAREDTVYSLYKPYKQASQKEISLQEAMNHFFSDYGIKSSFQDYEELKEKFPLSPFSLFPDVTETLERINQLGIPFIILTDASNTSEELATRLRGMLIDQLKSRGVYEASFSLSDYVEQQISSKDLGLTKPDPYFFELGIGNHNNPIFIAHSPDEVFGAADQGIDVLALNPEREGISEAIVAYNKAGQGGRIFTGQYFRDILKLL